MADFYELLVSFILGLGGGVAIAFASSVFTVRQQEKQEEKNATADLVSEMRQNQHHQEVAFHIPLEVDAYGRFRQFGLMTGLKKETHDLLIELYSRIRDKNGLVAIYLSKGNVNITGGGKEEPVSDIIERLRKEIDDLITKRLLYLFGD